MVLIVVVNATEEAAVAETDMAVTDVQAVAVAVAVDVTAVMAVKGATEGNPLPSLLIFKGLAICPIFINIRQVSPPLFFALFLQYRPTFAYLYYMREEDADAIK